MKRCQSCGRLIELLEDFAGLDQSSIYCSSCADDSGKIKSFEEVLDNLTQRIAKTDGFDESASRNAALQILGRQPAWEPRFKREEKVKTNRRKLVLALVAVVFALSAGGAAWWLTSMHYQVKDETYMLHVSNNDDPFRDIQTTKIDDYSIKEFRCKGDQRILELENGILKFDSVRAKKNDYLDAVIVSDLSYIYDNDFDEFREKYYANVYKYNIINNEKMIDEDNQKIIYYNNNIVMNNDKKDDAYYFQEDFDLYRFIDTNHITDVSKENEIIATENTCNNKVLYRNENISIELFPEVSNKYIKNRAIYIFEDQNLIRKIDISGNNYSIEKEDSNSKYVIIDYSLIKYLKQYLIVDLQNLNYKIITLDADDKIYLFDDNIVYLNSQDQLLKYDFANDRSDLLYTIPRRMKFFNFINQVNCSYLIIYDWFNRSNSVYRRIDLNKNEIEDINIINSSVAPSIIGKYAISCDSNDFRFSKLYSNNDGYILKREYFAIDNNLHKLYITNLETNKMTLLDDKFSGELTIDENVIAWTRNNGSKDDQWKNVCFTKIPDTK